MSVPRKVPDWLIERVALGELPAEALEAARRAIDADPEARARLARLAEEDAAFLAAHPPATTVPAIRRAAAPPAARSPWRPLAWAAPVLAAAAALALVVGLPETPRPETERGKGLGSHVTVHHRTADGRVVRLADGDSARPGDLLQLSYVADGAAHGVVLSIDGRGVVTLHFPPSEDASTDLVDDGAVALREAYELDAAPDFERFVFVTSRYPIDVQALLAETEPFVRASSAPDVEPLPLDAGQAQRSFLLRKTEEP